MRELEIKENDANQRLDKFLQKTLHNLPTNLMYKYIRNKKIKVNRKRCTINQKLVVGDIVTCYIAEEFFMFEKDDSFLKSKGSLHIVYEDDNIVIMNKPIGLVCHTSMDETVETLINQMKKYLYEKQEYDYLHEQSFTPALCNRLDRNTQGLVIGAKSAEALREINYLIKQDSIHKYYYAIVEGKLEKESDTLIHYHKRGEKQVFIKDKQEEGYQQVKLSYKLLESFKNASLVDILLITGKTHQIRAQFGHIGHPLLYDTKYGAKQSKDNYQALCAYKIVFEVDESLSLSYLNKKEVQIKQKDITLFKYWK